MNAPWSSRQQLNSFVVTVTNEWAASTAKATASTTTPRSSVETVESVELGQTVTLTVTHDPVQSSQPTSDAPLAADRTSENSTPVGAIAGGVVGGVVLLASAIFLLFFFRRRKSTKEQRRATLPPPYPGIDMSEQLAGESKSFLTVNNAAYVAQVLRLQPIPKQTSLSMTTAHRPISCRNLTVLR
jgi:hypothetical protein